MRERQQELMDDPDLDRAEHEHALRGLARLNRYSNATRLLWGSIKNVVRDCQLNNCTILDVATGSADVPLSLLKRARADGIDLQVSGCDISPVATACASQRMQLEGFPNASFYTLDILKEQIPDRYDIVINSLFMHHLADSEVISVLRKMKQAAKHAVVINDLERSTANLVMVGIACHALTTSRVVRFDGPASVKSAYSMWEFKSLADHAGFDGAEFRRQFPCRFFMTWRTSQ